MMSVFVMGTMIALPVLKKSKVELAKENTSKIDKSYASESLSQTSAKNTSSVSTNSTDSNALTRNYEIKSEQSWDVSKNQDGSVIAKFTLSDRTLRISGSGEMKDWKYNEKCDWHDSQYTKIIDNVIIENGITNIGDYAFEECSSLISINVNEGNNSYVSEESKWKKLER